MVRFDVIKPEGWVTKTLTEDIEFSLKRIIKGKRLGWAVDAKVYDRNDILKKDAYFGRTVMALINGCLFHFPQIKPEMEDYKFIQTRISQQYINQYNATYGIS